MRHYEEPIRKSEHTETGIYLGRATEKPIPDELYLDANSYFSETPLQLKASAEVYLYQGGPEFFNGLQLPPEYGFVRKLYLDTKLVGLVHYPVNACLTSHAGEIFLLSETTSKNRVVVSLPLDGDLHYYDPVTHRNARIDPYLVISDNVPRRQRIAFSDDDIRSFMEISSNDELNHFLHAHNVLNSDRMSYVERGLETFVDISQERVVSQTERCSRFCMMWLYSHYEFAGTELPFMSAEGNWPFKYPCFPEDSGGEDLCVTSELDRKRMMNVMSNVAAIAKLVSINKWQLTVFESNLIKLGLEDCDSQKRISKTQQYFCSTCGESFHNIGGKSFSERSVHFLSRNCTNSPCNCYCSPRLIEKTCDQKCCSAWRSGELYKRTNHSDWIVPERQRGLEVMVPFNNNPSMYCNGGEMSIFDHAGPRYQGTKRPLTKDNSKACSVTKSIRELLSSLEATHNGSKLNPFDLGFFSSISLSPGKNKQGIVVQIVRYQTDPNVDEMIKEVIMENLDYIDHVEVEVIDGKGWSKKNITQKGFISLSGPGNEWLSME